jgi:hypothetical protein
MFKSIKYIICAHALSYKEGEGGTEQRAKWLPAVLLGVMGRINVVSGYMLPGRVFGNPRLPQSMHIFLPPGASQSLLNSSKWAGSQSLSLV